MRVHVRSRWGVLLALGVGLGAGMPTSRPSAEPPLNQGVLKYATAQVGKKVGNGECWTLAAEALKDAGAKHANGYTFGRKLDKAEPVLPGDVMQFTSARFAGHSGRRSWTVELGFPHHTAVVQAVEGPTKYRILEQNPGPVKAATIDFKDLKSGSYEVYRPEPAAPHKEKK